MLLTWLLTPLLSLFSSIIGTLPDADTSRFLGTSAYNPVMSSGFLTWMNNASFYVPLAIITDALVFLLAIFLPAIMVFQLAQWAYRELPDLWGFGPS